MIIAQTCVRSVGIVWTGVCSVGTVWKHVRTVTTVKLIISVFHLPVFAPTLPVRFLFDFSSLSSCSLLLLLVDFLQ